MERPGEEERFKKYKSLPNHQLLWHGSRLTNWVGILSQGLRIAPPEAPSTGYMFGKGGTTDQRGRNLLSSSSGGHASLISIACSVLCGYGDQERQLLSRQPRESLRSAVALARGPGQDLRLHAGRVHGQQQAGLRLHQGMRRHRTRSRRGRHPVRCSPRHPRLFSVLMGAFRPDGTLVPLGKPAPTGVNNTSLLYNEFIVYDVAQVRPLPISMLGAEGRRLIIVHLLRTSAADGQVPRGGGVQVELNLHA